MPAKNETNESLQAFAADAEALLAYIEASIDLEPKQGGVDCAKLRRGSRKAFHDGKPGRTTVGARRFRELIDAVLESGKTASHAGVSDVDFNTLQGFAHALRCANPTLWETPQGHPEWANVDYVVAGASVPDSLLDARKAWTRLQGLLKHEDRTHSATKKRNDKLLVYLDKTRLRVRIGDKEYGVTLAQYDVFEAIAKADGAWVQAGGADGAIAARKRPGQIIDRMRKPVQQCIERSHQGYRLRPSVVIHFA